MANIFVSYSKQDRVLALKLSSWLEAQGWTTWRDKTVVADGIRDENVTELNQARAVIVLWSAASVDSPHILHEAIAARDAKKLLHVKVSGLDRTTDPGLAWRPDSARRPRSTVNRPSGSKHSRQ